MKAYKERGKERANPTAAITAESGGRNRGWQGGKTH